MSRISRLTCTLSLVLPLAAPAGAEVLSTTDPTIRDNLCVGGGCLATETFNGNYSALKLKSNNTRILFEDDSATAGFPANDWAIQANDRLNGGEDQLMFIDDTTGAEILTIKAGAPSSTLVLDGDGQVGIGTELPQSPLHVEATATEGIRLNRSNAAGGGQAWETVIFGNGDFGLSDITNTTTPFAMRPGTPNNAIFLEFDTAQINSGNRDYNFEVRWDEGSAFWADGGTGDIGMGTTTPSAPLHIVSNDPAAADDQGVLVENTSFTPGVRGLFTMRNRGGSYFTLDNTDSGTVWYFVHENASPNRFIITDGVNDGPEMVVSAEGNLTIQGELFTAGSCAAGCDRVFDEDYPLPSIAEQAAMMKANKHLPNVGQTPEDGPFNITAMTGGMLNELEKAHLYIAELHDTVETERARNAAQEARIARLEAQLATLTAGR
ncbi:hypothetical protein ACN2XU_02915 [Primorskyibacter sp. 2E107]|uniref:hypothetical protein n=1 Tax=Primorskyibacter sp. 2E107 TaxID=3403458 RepID=UPI003AF753BC